jgi:hypothetical protein
MLKHSHILLVHLIVPTSGKDVLEKTKVKERLKAIKGWLVSLQRFKDPDITLLQHVNTWVLKLLKTLYYAKIEALLHRCNHILASKHL